jgi:hypothetical protein
MIDRVCVRAAVLATVFVANEHRMTRERCSPVVRNLDDIAQANHQRVTQNQTLGTDDCAVVFDELGFVSEHEARGSSGGHNAERLICCI